MNMTAPTPDPHIQMGAGQELSLLSIRTCCPLPPPPAPCPLPSDPLLPPLLLPSAPAPFPCLPLPTPAPCALPPAPAPALPSSPGPSRIAAGPAPADTRAGTRRPRGAAASCSPGPEGESAGWGWVGSLLGAGVGEAGWRAQQGSSGLLPWGGSPLLSWTLNPLGAPLSRRFKALTLSKGRAWAPRGKWE